MADMTCLVCHRSSYDGYDQDSAHTLPCKHCGHVMPNMLTLAMFKLLIEIRDKNIARERKSITNFCCSVCEVKYPPMFMVRDELWLAHFNAKEIACLECFERRLGRPLDDTDLTDVPINAWWKRRLTTLQKIHL